MVKLKIIIKFENLHTGLLQFRQLHYYIFEKHQSQITKLYYYISLWRKDYWAEYRNNERAAYFTTKER